MFATAEFETEETAASGSDPRRCRAGCERQTGGVSEGEHGSFGPREVTVGREGGGRVQVLSGLQPGDSVVVNGAYLLKTQMMKESGE